MGDKEKLLAAVIKIETAVTNLRKAIESENEAAMIDATAELVAALVVSGMILD